MIYFNDNEPYVAKWLTALYPDAIVNSGSVCDIQAGDLAQYRRVHLFAGIGGWEYALRLAGWPDDREVWTGSCPCQPFSNSGKRKGIDDERHLWPEFLRLISECRPTTIFGEQVASPLGREWLSRVRTDLEALGYAVGAADLCAAGVGAPHIRQRLFFGAVRLADTNDTGSQRRARVPERPDQCVVGPGGMVGGLADTTDPRRERGRSGEAGDGREPARIEPERLCDAGGLADTDGGESGQAGAIQSGREHGREPQDGRAMSDHQTDPHHGFWRDADWLGCRDGKWRPVEPGTQPLAHGVSGRVGLLRGYGNAIVPQIAAQFVRAFMGTER